MNICNDYNLIYKKLNQIVFVSTNIQSFIVGEISVSWTKLMRYKVINNNHSVKYTLKHTLIHRRRFNITIPKKILIEKAEGKNCTAVVQ